MVILISSRTRRSSRPRSAQLMVTCLISSSKHWAYNSSRTGQIPVSRACRSVTQEVWDELTVCMHACMGLLRGSHISGEGRIVRPDVAEAADLTFLGGWSHPVWLQVCWIHTGPKVDPPLSIPCTFQALDDAPVVTNKWKPYAFFTLEVG
jgi:hypothetical protein